MLLSQLVEINEKAIVASSVNFKLMDDQQINQLLCEGFIFNYNSQNSKISTVGLLDILRRSYHSRNEPNIHLMIQDYGKGKSHFAVVIANYFKQSYNSPEVQGILHQIEMATTEKKGNLAEELRLYKQNQRDQHLVICLSGDRGGDLKKQFLQTLLTILEEEGVYDSFAQHICSEPLRYLESLSPEDRLKAEQYLESIGNPEGDINQLIQLLKEHDSSVISIIKKLARHLTGFYPDFQADIDLEAILENLIKNLCSGENKRFEGILILFDELNYYLQSWAKDQIGAGGTAIQNITNICERHKGKIALLSLTQIHPSSVSNISATTTGDYQKLASRLAPKDTTYNPESSLELVLDNLLIQKNDTPGSQEFRKRWHGTLLAEARTTYEKRTKIYQNKGWSLDQFNRHLAQGCFPLHPLTSYLLCNLDFTQDRTAIEFVKSYVKEFIKNQLVEDENKLNFIYPIALLDSFIENFAKSSAYSSYKKSQGLISEKDNLDELIVIKALFLYYASGDKLTKTDREDHEEVLTSLTGFLRSKLKTILDQLCERREVIYYQPATKLYRFFDGINPREIEEKVEEEIKNKSLSINEIATYCNANLEQYSAKTITALNFVEDNKLINDDWQFEYKIHSISSFESIILKKDLQNIDKKGLFIYVLAETREDLEQFRQKIDKTLLNSPVADKFVVAIPNEETGDLARLLLRIKTLENFDNTEKRIYGAACEQLYSRWKDQREQQIKNLLKSCTYHCKVIDKVSLSERKKPDKVISALLQDLYTFVPPIEKIDKMRSGHPTGSKIVRYAAKQLLIDDLKPQGLPPETSYKTVIDDIFVNSWGLLKKSSQKYTIQEPTNKKVKAAWDFISQESDLKDSSERIVNLKDIWLTLSQPPYGYHELTFTVLLAGWLAYNHKEVYLKGHDKVTLKRNEQATLKTQSPKDWASTNIWEKPKEFINKWICEPNSKLIRRRRKEAPSLPLSTITYECAQQYLEDVKQFIEFEEPEQVEVKDIIQKQKQISDAVRLINDWFAPVEEAEGLSNSSNFEGLLQLYSQLCQSYSAFDLNKAVVTPTQEQCNRKEQALEEVRRQIEALIEQKCERANFLSSESDCEAYKDQIERYITQISTISFLPTHLTESFRNALQTVEITKRKLQEQAAITKSLSEIKQLYNRLNPNSTQDDYTQTRQSISKLAHNLLNDSESLEEIQHFLQDIEKNYQELSQKLDLWEDKIYRPISNEQILELIKETARQQSRFTEEIYKKRVIFIQERLDNLLEFEKRDKSENCSEIELVNQDLQEVSKDKEDQIISLFCQLSQQQRQSLYEKLTKYLLQEDLYE